MEEKPEGFKSRLDDVFGGLDGIGFKSDSSLKQTPLKAEDADFRRPRSPTRRSDHGSSGGGNRDATSEPRSRSFDKFKKTDSIFQESQDVGSWRKKDFKPPSNFRSSSRGPPPPQSSHHHHKRPKNPMFDHRRPQHKDPKKYTKYSLADVKDVTDKSNTQAALAFLQDRKRKQEPEEHDEGGEGGKVVFKKPKKGHQPESDSSGSNSASDFGLSCGNSKRVMPEAIVGQTKAKKVGSKAKAASSSTESSKVSKKQNRLSHLSFEDEEEED